MNRNGGSKYPYGYGSGQHLARLVALIGKLQRDPNQPRSDQNNQDANEGALARYTRNLVIATSVIAIVGVLNFGAVLLQWDTMRHTDDATHDLASAAKIQSEASGQQATIMKGQLDEMHDQRRPWLAVNRVVSTGDLVWFNGFKPWLTFGIEIKIMGQMPAQKIVASGIIVPNAATVNMLTSQMEVCDRMCAPPPPNSQRIERTIFPDQIQEIEVVAIDQTNAFNELWRSGDTKIGPTIIGCAVYQEPGGHYHRTGFVYDLLMKNPAVAGGVEAISLAHGNIPAATLEFRPNFWGNGPAD